MDKIKILLCDAHTAVRASTRGILESERGFEVVAEASDGEEVVTLTENLSPDVAIYDIVMPRLDGLKATRQIKEHCPDTAVLILTLYNDDPHVLAALEAGADGYLLKTARGQELIRAVREVYAREFSLNRWLASAVSRVCAGKNKDGAFRAQCPNLASPRGVPRRRSPGRRARSQ